ncbi:hypothetical protein SCLCIDRAFT_26876 [Scleroderma citrinum Foug A]|uniref:Uncharacterized protein n=1 Tax=Scleroderma citrinum Foug A TaxID=1036808 RepID=A0A0C3DVB6_9AGAM|nr:hypothetical protein SCLCIDRAFT_26876 [Scleroderma citrinum Foug A]
MSSTANEEDNNSLFGSPPPSPLQDSFERNVSTIALPGSHILSYSTPAASNVVVGVPQVNDPDAIGEASSQCSQCSIVNVKKCQKRSTASSRSNTANRRPLPSRDEILKNARERQRQLVAELESAKVELWEASIEGGVLVHLMRDSKVNSQLTAG